MVRVEPGAVQAIKVFLAQTGAEGPLRVDLLSTGCCDPSLGLRLDRVEGSDITEDVEGITFVVSPEVQRLFGEITISYIDEKDRQGFLITSERPVSEWVGFGVSAIRV